MRQLFRQHVITKTEWKRSILKKAWDLEDSFWERQMFLQKKCHFLVKSLQKPRNLTWWYLSDLHPNLMSYCEDMAKLVCNASKLKADDISLKNSTHGSRMCIECNLGIEENIKHIIMQCQAYEEIRREMFDSILKLPNDIGIELLSDPSQTLLLLLGKSDDRFEIEHLIQFWSISARSVSKIYRLVIKNRLVVGIQT